MMSFTISNPVVAGESAENDFVIGSTVDPVARTCDTTIEVTRARDGDPFSEQHRQYFHTDADVRAALQDAGFAVSAVGDEYTHEPASAVDPARDLDCTASTGLSFCRVSLRPTRIATQRLVLAPLDDEVAHAVLAGDPSGVTRADGWPHDDTLDALRMATAPGGGSLVWLVMLDDVVIGDCGTVGGLDDEGAIEIGYGLAAEHRGRGYGNELVGALSGLASVAA